MAIDKDMLDQLLAGRDPQDLFAKDGPPRRLWPRPHKTGTAQIEVIDESIDEPHRIVRSHIVLDRRRQEQRLVPSMTFDVCLACKLHRPDATWNQERRFRTV